ERNGDIAAKYSLARETAMIRLGGIEGQPAAGVQNQSGMDSLGLEWTDQLAVKRDHGDFAKGDRHILLGRFDLHITGLAVDRIQGPLDNIAVPQVHGVPGSLGGGEATPPLIHVIYTVGSSYAQHRTSTKEARKN